MRWKCVIWIKPKKGGIRWSLENVWYGSNSTKIALIEYQLKDWAGLSGIENKYKGWEKVVTCRSCHLDQTKNSQWYMCLLTKILQQDIQNTKLSEKKLLIWLRLMQMDTNTLWLFFACPCFHIETFLFIRLIPAVIHT